MRINIIKKRKRFLDKIQKLQSDIDTCKCGEKKKLETAQNSI